MMNSLCIEFPISVYGGPDVIVEAGHVYTSELLGIEHKTGAMIGSRVSSFLKVAGYNTNNWLFIDDYNPGFEGKEAILDENDYRRQLASLGFSPQTTVYESEFVLHAKDVLKFLLENGYAGEKGDKHVLYKGNIALHDKKTDRFACALLDACCYMQKRKKSDFLITVLDKTYVTQQKDTMTILKKLDKPTNGIFPVFFSKPSEVEANDKNSNIGIQNALYMMKLMAKFSGVVKDELDIEMDVMNHVV